MDPHRSSYPLSTPDPARPAPAQPQVVVQYVAPTRDPGLAVVLEMIPGLMAQTFGIGTIYAGNVAAGLFIMFGYWVLQFVNILLCFVLVGFLTLPLTWVAFMIFAPIVANESARRFRAY